MVFTNNIPMFICVCYAVTDVVIDAAIANGAMSVEAVARACRAGGDCGACRGAIATMIDESDGKHRLPSYQGSQAAPRKRQAA
jgi:bacterioferritin-associated ferredoxin